MFANAQNKHAAPGICTMSGDSLLRLYRCTSKTAYLELLRTFARYPAVRVTRRPAADDLGRRFSAGGLHQRTGAAQRLGRPETIGEVRSGSCWPEVSMLLTYAEVPGIYADRHSGLDGARSR